METHKLDTDAQVFFYEQDFYVLSNFSAFTIMHRGLRFQTVEQAYHWNKFWPRPMEVDKVIWSHHRDMIFHSISAHEAFKYAERYRADRRGDWDERKVGVMRDLLQEKAQQHEYVRRKLLATGERELIEDSWRDDFWGWGPNRDGKNMLGKLWMEIRAEILAVKAA